MQVMEQDTIKGKRIVISNYDLTLVLLVVLLGVFGLIMIYSTSSYNAARYYNNPSLYVTRQLKFFIAGFLLMIAISFIDYRLYVTKIFGIRPIWLLYVLSLGLQAYVLIAGYVAGGSSRWIKLSVGQNFQPSEISKFCVVLFTSYIVQKIPSQLKSFSGFLATSIYVIPLIVLVAVQNLSTAIVMMGIFVCICFVVSRNKLYYVYVVLLGAVFVAAFILNAGYRSNRIIAWLYPDSLESGSQILQGLYAIASGGLFGKGLGESIQKLGYIPEVHTDMIFTVICEELGIVGAILVIAVYLMLLWRLFHIAFNAPDMFGGLIATGVFAHIALQVLINIAVVTNTIPATGMPLPFISYGGSSLLILMCEMGVVLSVSRCTNTRNIP